jgi:subtilisin family serine protease
VRRFLTMIVAATLTLTMGSIRATVQADGTSYPNDPLFARQWNLHNTGQNGGTPGADIHATQAWGITRCSPNVVIAVLDTGVDPTHPDLQGKLVPGATFIPGTNSPADDNGHGTQMAGIAAAGTDNGQGIAGVCPLGKIMPVKVATAQGHTDDAEGDVQVAAGLRWAVDHGANIISFSLGVLDTPAIRDAVNYAYAHNVLIVAAAGNSGDNQSPYPAPAMYPHVLAVGGTDNKDRRTSYSSYGFPHLVLAPSEDIETTGLHGQYESGGYTSIAAPQVAGIAALILSIRPGLSVDQLITVIEQGADPVDGQTGPTAKEGYGRVNAYKSLLLAQALVSATPTVIHVGRGTSASFTVTFSSKSAGTGAVLFGSGPDCQGLVQISMSDQQSGTTTHTVVVTGNDLPGTVGNIGLQPGQTYSYEVVTETSAGPEIDNNNGRCYTVTIPEM